jgi:hypothetical protein
MSENMELIESRKFDILAKEAQSQNKLFNKFLDILNKEEDD